MKTEVVRSEMTGYLRFTLKCSTKKKGIEVGLGIGETRVTRHLFYPEGDGGVHGADYTIQFLC